MVEHFEVTEPLCSSNIDSFPVDSVFGKTAVFSLWKDKREKIVPSFYHTSQRRKRDRHSIHY